jgi:hypothetical protein
MIRPLLAAITKNHRADIQRPGLNEFEARLWQSGVEGELLGGDLAGAADREAVLTGFGPTRVNA